MWEGGGQRHGAYAVVGPLKGTSTPGLQNPLSAAYVRS